jgi:hypothetical protein
LSTDKGSPSSEGSDASTFEAILSWSDAYCKEVRKLEDKFHGLELIHVSHRYNEAADELAKIAST